MAERVAEILFKGQRAGLLYEMPGGGTRFIYDPGWDAAIGCCLPVAGREHVWAAGLHPFFEHLGPEGWLREKQVRAGRIEEEDDLGLLLRYGRDCIGAVSLRDGQEGAEPFPAAASLETRAAAAGSRTVSGVQKKLLVYRQGESWLPADAAGPATHIAKFNPESNATLIRNEWLSLRFAQDVLGADQVTEFATGVITGLDAPALLVTRFDRTPTGEKLRLDDFAQILPKARGRDFRGKYESSYEEAAALITAHSARPRIDLDRFFRRVVFNILIGNADAHLKNFSLLEAKEGLRLAPAYDMLNTLFYGGDYDTRTALGLGGDKPPLDRIGRPQVAAFGAAVGLPDRAVALALRDIRHRVGKSRVLVPSGGEDPGGFVHRYAEIVEGACLRILETA